MRHPYIAFLAGALLVSVTRLPAQSATRPDAGASRAYDHAAAPTARAAPLAGEIQVDGRPDEAAWQAAEPITAFIQYDPKEGEPVSERTEVRLLIGGDALYIGARLYDSDPRGIRSRLARRDRPAESDLFEVWLDSGHEHLTGYRLRVNPAGAIRDAAVLRQGEDDSWDPVWQAAAQIDSLGWTAEMRIPLSQLRYDVADDVVFGIQLGRMIFRKQEAAFFPFTPKSEQLGPHRWAHLVGLGRLPHARHLELLPYARGRAEYLNTAPGNPFRDESELAGSVGLDLKYGVTSNLTLDATVNPDFGQVEVDPAVVNLSAFETFFQERRPFFVEGADLFRFGRTRTQNSSFGANVFHSRRIGRPPQRGLGPAYRFADAPDETTIAGAMKLTGRARGWNVGVLDAVTTGEHARYLDAAGVEQEAAVEPLTNYFLARVARNLRGGHTSIGGLATAVNRRLDDAAFDPLLRSGAYVAGLDWNHAWRNRRWVFDGFLALSRVEGDAAALARTQASSARYYQRPDAEHVDLDATRTNLSGNAAELALLKLAGEHWTGGITYQHTSPGYEVNDLGFQSRADVRSLSWHVVYSQNEPGRVLRDYGLFLFSNESWNYDGDLIQAGLGLLGFGRFLNFTNYFFRIDYAPETWDDRLTRGGPLAQRTRGGNVVLEFHSDARKRLEFAVEAAGSWGTTTRGYRSLGLGFNYRPSPSLRLTLSPTYRTSHDDVQYVATIADTLAHATYGHRYVFADLEQDALALQTRLDWTFTPRLSLQLYAQPLVASGAYGAPKEFRAPRTFVFDVYGQDRGTAARDDDNRTYTIDPDGAGPAAAFVVPDLDFNFRSLRGNAVLRWEYRPGSTLFLVWQQRRAGSAPIGNFDFGRDYGALFDQKPENVFALKATFWVGL